MAWTIMSKTLMFNVEWEKALSVTWLATIEVPKFLFMNLTMAHRPQSTTGDQCNRAVIMKFFTSLLIYDMTMSGWKTITFQSVQNNGIQSHTFKDVCLSSNKGLFKK